MSNLQNAIDEFNKKRRAADIITEYLEKIFGDTDFELIENTNDNDLKVRFPDDNLGTDIIEDIQEMFEITLINSDDHHLEIDLRLKE